MKIKEHSVYPSKLINFLRGRSCKQMRQALYCTIYGHLVCRTYALSCSSMMVNVNLN